MTEKESAFLEVTLDLLNQIEDGMKEQCDRQENILKETFEELDRRKHSDQVTKVMAEVDNRERVDDV